MYHFITPCSISVSGQSMAGKSTYVAKLVQQRKELFNPCHIKKVLWYSPVAEIKNPLNNVFYTSEIPDLSNLPRQTMLILDDAQTELVNNPEFVTLLTREAHHKDLVIIYIQHNVFTPSKYGRTASINFIYQIIFGNPRDILCCSILSRQTILGKKMEQAYKKVTEEPYQPLICDFSMKCPNKFRLRSHILRDDGFCRVYL